MRHLTEKVHPLRRSTFLVAVATIGAVGWLTGCTVGPNYVTPTVEVPAGYKENAGWQVAQPQDATLRGKWWEIFDDPQLNAFEEQVDVSNQNIALAEAQFRQARALVQQHRCNFCHNPDFSGAQQVPRLAGQREDYLVKALREYKNNTRRAYDAAMADVLYVLNDEQLRDLAYFLARLP